MAQCLPNHYRLLGVDPFEDDADLLARAAERRAEHVRNFRTGEHATEAQLLLAELAAAKACLLDLEKKAIYDAGRLLVSQGVAKGIGLYANANRTPSETVQSPAGEPLKTEPWGGERLALPGAEGLANGTQRHPTVRLVDIRCYVAY